MNDYDIRDKGIGISKQDIAFMKSVGASAKNLERKTIIGRIPQWMRPSGAFGIGLQSAFMLCPEIIFESKSLLTGDSLKVEMKSPLGQQRGLIYVQKCSQAPGRDSGTLMSITIDAEAIPKSISFGDQSDRFTQAVLADFDPIRMAEVPYEAARMVDEIMRFSILSPVPIHLNFNGQALSRDHADVADDDRLPYFCSKTGIMLMNARFTEANYTHSSVAFRGQAIEGYYPRIPFVEFSADILAELAPDTLTINRNDVKATAEKHIHELLINTIVDYLADEKYPLAPKERPCASAFLHWYGKEDVQSSLREQWRNMVSTELRCSIACLCQKDEFEIYVPFLTGIDTTTAPKDVFCIESVAAAYVTLLFKAWGEQNGYVQKKDKWNWDGTVLYFSKTPIPPFADAYLIKELTAKQTSYRVGGRFCMPAWGEYEKLSADVSKLPWCHSLSDCHPFREHFILPFFFAKHGDEVTTQGLDELCDWTVKNARHIGTIKTEIRALYDKFVNWVDKELMADTPKWATMRGRGE